MNQQLIDYIKSQLQVGVGRDVIKGALLESGWADADITEALKQASGAQPASFGAAHAAPATSPASATAKPAAAANGAVVMTSDIFQPKNEPVFDPKSVAQPAAKPQSVTVAATAVKRAEPVVVGAAAAASSFGAKKPGISFATIALGVGFVVAAGAAVFLFMKQGDLAGQSAALDAARAEGDVAKQQVAALTQERDNLAAQITQFQNANTALANDLAIFKIPEGTPAGATGNIVVTGSLRQTAGQYVVFTPNEVTVVVKNSRDAAVDAALKALVGNTVTISGEHALGSREITVTAVNGAPVQ